MRRLVIAAAAIVAASLFALSVQGGHWWRISGVFVGPFNSHRCFGGECTAAGLGWVGDPRWERIGTATWAAGLIASLGLVALAAAIASKRTPRLITKFTIVAIGTAAIAGGAFVALAPAISDSGRELERGLYLFVAAIVIGAAAIVGQLRSLRNASPTLATTPSP